MNNNNVMKNLTPFQIVKALDEYIIGQDDAKRAVAIALRNRWRRQQVSGSIKEEIMPNNIILIGPTGVGKTEIARRLAKLSGAPFIKVEASKFTEVGYVGRDVESMIRDLTEISVNMVRSEKTMEVKEKADVIAEDKILDILIPPVKKPAVKVEGNENEEEVQNEKTREWMRKKLKNGELDDKMIEFDATIPSSGMQIMGPMGMDDMGINIQEIVTNMMPKKKKKRKTIIRDARKIISQEEAQKLIDMEAVQQEAIRRVQESGIVFIDEIDKVAGGGSKAQGPDVSREGVQRDLLPIVEGSTVNTKYGVVKTDHVLFIASGAFHIAKPSDLIPELQGRFPIRVELKSLSEQDFIKILTLPQNALLKQYAALLKTESVDISFNESAIIEVAKTAAHVNEQVENIGARRLHTILTTLLEDILFEVPDKMPAESIEITGEMVTEKLNVIVKDRDLSKYIL
ncbi:MAG: ATP-dependent protease ATPase subunit HslU [Ignavibacteriae bacterium]|nr:ATP-dependent protease ATPase subunit HslU [Ignavibacteriota bacterium]NOG99818.1 ATP-dependent protease ATPase subunit HslU [Ignavibacteriota bacterium]